MAFFLVVTWILNRVGLTRVAAFIIPSALTLLTMLAVLSAPGGLRLIVLPAYDLFVIPIFIAALTADWRAPWVFAVIASAFILVDWNLQAHALVTATGVDLTRTRGFDELARETAIFTPWGMVNRHLADLIFASLFSSIGAFSVERAILRADRADRAEEIARLEHAAAEQRRQLETGVQQLLETHVRLANGDFSARAPLIKDNLLWQVAASLNNLTTRMQNAFRAEHQLRRLEEELHRLAAALDDAKAGRPPIWPAPTGTAADLITDRITGRSRQPAAAPPTASRRQQQPAAQPSPYSASAAPHAQSFVPGQWPTESHYGLDTGDPYGAQGQSVPDPANPWRIPPEG
jgi:hypothetical protein